MASDEVNAFLRELYEQEIERRLAEERAAQEEFDAINRAAFDIAEWFEGNPEPLPPEPKLSEAELAKVREALLASWEAVDSSRRRTHLFNGRIPNPKPKHPRSPLISKNQFYAWLSGRLSPGHEPVRRLEEYLKANIPRQSMDQNFRAK